jgi:hypothetical protein
MRKNMTCQYPGPGRVKRQPPKKSTTNIALQLEKLEQSIATIINERPNTLDNQTQGPSTSSPAPNDRSDYKSPSSNSAAADQGFLGKDGRYINEPLLSQVLEKEKELQSAIGSPIDGRSPRRPPVLRADGLFSNPLLGDIDARKLFPSRWQAVSLWEAFINRVDPLIKVIHVPTAQSRIFAAINRPESVGADVRALLCAICFAATTTLLSEDTQNEVLFADLRRYQQGLELSLYHSDFLDAPTLTSLQAMVIYQVR